MSKSSAGRIVGIGFLAILMVLGGLAGWQVHQSSELRRWDEKVDALCAANGGRDVSTKIYETATAPDTPEYFRGTAQRRSLGIPARSAGISLGPRYPYVIETRVLEVIHHSDPSVVRYTERIVRTVDNKVLSERFAYQRGGGFSLGFDPGEVKTCPILRTEDRLDVRTFVNHPRHNPLEAK